MVSEMVSVIVSVKDKDSDDRRYLAVAEDPDLLQINGFEYPFLWIADDDIRFRFALCKASDYKYFSIFGDVESGERWLKIVFDCLEGREEGDIELIESDCVYNPNPSDTHWKPSVKRVVKKLELRND